MNIKHAYRYMLALLACGFAILSGMSLTSKTASATLWSQNYTTITSTNGSGTTESNPILISTAAQLAGLAVRVNSTASGSVPYRSYYYRLTNSIDLSGHNWVPIGSTNAFSGQFDGGNFVIKNMKIESTSNNVGLFGYTSGATIKNLRVEGTIYSTSKIENVGGFVGKAIGTTINRVSSAITINVKNATNVGGVIGMAQGGSGIMSKIDVANNLNPITGQKFVGGIAGYMNGNIYNSYNSAKIKGEQYIAGIASKLVFRSYLSYIYNSYNIGEVEATTNSAGGILATIAYVDTTEVLSGNNGVFESQTYWYIPRGAGAKNCYNAGNVKSAGSDVGGIAASLSGSDVQLYGSDHQIENCYNTGTITGAYYVGGIVGSVSWVTIKNVSNSGNISGKGRIGGICGFIYWSSKIDSAYNGGKIVGSEDDVGGIVGLNIGHANVTDSTVLNSSNSGEIVGVNNVGGIYGTGASIINCFNTGFINASGENVGGLEGNSDIGKEFKILDSYNQGTVSGKNNRGGLVGYFEECYVDYIIRNCYNTGTVSKNGYTKYVGSLVGRNVYDRGDVINCYYLANSSEPNKGLGTKGGGGTNYSKVYQKTSTELKATSIATTISSYMSAKTNSYPILANTRSGMVTIALPNTIWQIRSNTNNGYPIFIDFYW